MIQHATRITFFFALLGFLAVPTSFADAPFSTLLAYTQTEYRFDYRGDHTLITITLDAPDGVELAVYAPTNPETPVGRGSRARNDKIVWAGKFPAPGIYKAIVTNRTPAPIAYRIENAGEGVSGFTPILTDAPQATAYEANRTLTVNLPPGAGLNALRLTIPRTPNNCTHANQIPPLIEQSVKLCAGEIYPPLHIVGNNIALFADGLHSSIVTSAGRQFGIRAEGNNLWIDGVTIQASADANDVGAFLCLYDECVFDTKPRTTLRGGIQYGGGILVTGSNSVVRNVTVRGGTIGVATVNGWNNLIVDNQLNDLNGWGSFNTASVGSYFVGNTFNRENHACVTPDGYTFLHGCETAGWVCLMCARNLIARNHCESSADCFYLSGERGLASNDNRLIANYCAGATDNCFELTFSRGNVLLDNVTTADPHTGASCKYPFWIGGSTTYMGKNTWQCRISVEDSIRDARASTDVPTIPVFLDELSPVPSAPVPVYFRRSGRLQ